MSDYSMSFSDLEHDLLDLQRRIRETSEQEDALCERLRELDKFPADSDGMGDTSPSPDEDAPRDQSVTDSPDDGQRLPMPTEVVIHEDSESPVPYGCHRIIKTYDNGVPIAWADVPDGQPDPEPMYLCTEAARIYMMSDEEYDEYERTKQGQRGASPSDAPPPSVKVAATMLLMLPCMWVIFIVACLMLWSAYPAFFVTTGILLFVATAWSLAKIMRYPKVAEAGSTGIHLRGRASRQALPHGNGTDVNDACSLLSEHVGNADVGVLAEDGLRQVDAATTKHGQVMSLVDETFSSGSLSWNRFAGTVDDTCDAIGRNAVAMADDLREYDEMRLNEEATRHLSMARIRDEQRQAEDALITSMHQHVRDNEMLLLELDKLRQELLRLKGDRSTEDNTTALEEIRRLVAETPEYR